MYPFVFKHLQQEVIVPSQFSHSYLSQDTYNLCVLFEGRHSYSSSYFSAVSTDPRTSQQFDTHLSNKWKKIPLFLTQVFPYFCLWFFSHSKMWSKRDESGIRWVHIYIGFHFFQVLPLIQTGKELAHLLGMLEICWSLVPHPLESGEQRFQQESNSKWKCSLPTGKFIPLRSHYWQI